MVVCIRNEFDFSWTKIGVCANKHKHPHPKTDQIQKYRHPYYLLIWWVVGFKFSLVINKSLMFHTFNLHQCRHRSKPILYENYLKAFYANVWYGKSRESLNYNNLFYVISRLWIWTTVCECVCVDVCLNQNKVPSNFKQ